jgi:hypothetical protein
MNDKTIRDACKENTRYKEIRDVLRKRRKDSWDRLIRDVEQSRRKVNQ